MASDDPTIENVTWWTYVQEHSKGATQLEIAKRVGVTQSAVGRWKKSQPETSAVAQFARSYERPVLEAMIAAGHITAEDAGERPSAPPSLASVRGSDLLDELERRMKEGGTWEPGNSSGPEDEAALEVARPKFGAGSKRDRMIQQAMPVTRAARNVSNERPKK